MQLKGRHLARSCSAKSFSLKPFENNIFGTQLHAIKPFHGLQIEKPRASAQDACAQTADFPKLHLHENMEMIDFRILQE